MYEPDPRDMNLTSQQIGLSPQETEKHDDNNSKECTSDEEDGDFFTEVEDNDEKWFGLDLPRPKIPEINPILSIVTSVSESKNVAIQNPIIAKAYEDLSGSFACALLD